MPGVTEIAYAPLKKDIHLIDPGSDAYKTITEEALRRIKEWKGCQRIFWGVEIENPDKLRLFVDWESLEIHEQANENPAYLPAVLPIASLCSSTHTVYHATFEPHSPSVLGEAPVTEVMTTYFPADYSLDDQKTYERGMKKFFETCQACADGFLSSTGGWVNEVLEIEGGKSAKAYVGLFGWQSVEHHLSFRKTSPFQELRHAMGQPKDMQKLEVVHVKVTEFK